MAYAPEWWPMDDQNRPGVLDIALALHMDKRGSADPLPDATRRLYIRALQWKLDNWMSSSFEFDFAVKQVVRMSLLEIK